MAGTMTEPASNTRHSPFQRHIRFEGIENVRDFGGYATADGGRMATGLLYRGAHQAMASDADLETLLALRLGVIVDLRRTDERERAVSRRPRDCGAKVIANDLPQSKDDPFNNFLTNGALTAEGMRGFMRDYYRDAPFEVRHIDLYRRYFEVLTQGPGPVLIHCAAGKDRTGILAALTHHIAGVHTDDIMADYLLTNDAERFARRAPFLAAHIREVSGQTPSDAALHATMGVEPDYLHTAWAAITERHGSLDGYLTEVLEVDADRRARIKTFILA